MHLTIHGLSRLVEHHQLFAYILFLFIAIFEGEIVGISAGILVLLGAFNFWISLLVLFCGGAIKTLSGYSLGVFLHRKFNNNKFFQYIEKRVFTILPHFNRKPFWSIFISKFIIGSNHVVILFSGYQKIDFKTYLKAEIFSTLIWAPLLISLGYFFSYTALQVSRQVSEFSLIIILFVIGFFLLDKLVSLLYNLFENI